MRTFEHHQIWLQSVARARPHLFDPTLLSIGELDKGDPKRLCYRLVQIAARLAFHARAATLHRPSGWPWAEQLIVAFMCLDALPAPA